MTIQLLRRHYLKAALVLVLVFSTAACNEKAEQPQGLKVVATTNILGDVVRNIVAEDGSVEVLIPIGADPHDFQPSARQIATVATADLVIANGLGLEEGLLDVLESAVSDGVNVIFLGELLDPLPFNDSGSHDHESDDHESDDHESDDHESDPHIWMDPDRMAIAAQIIGESLLSLEPSVNWLSRSQAYAEALREADSQIRSLLSRVPEAQRKLVTNHDSLGYFSASYGFEVIGVVIPKGTTLAEPSSSRLADLIDDIRQENISAIFVETTESDNLARSIAEETATPVQIVEIYTGSLGGSGSGAETLIEMLITNARLIAEALS